MKILKYAKVKQVSKIYLFIVQSIPIGRYLLITVSPISIYLVIENSCLSCHCSASK